MILKTYARQYTFFEEVPAVRIAAIQAQSDIEKGSYSEALEKLRTVFNNSISDFTKEKIFFLRGVAFYYWKEQRLYEEPYSIHRYLITNNALTTPARIRQITIVHYLEAIDSFKKAIALNQSNYFAFYGKGKAFLKNGNTQEGFACVIEATKISSYSPRLIQKCQKIYEKYPSLRFIDLNIPAHEDLEELLSQLFTHHSTYFRELAVYKIDRALNSAERVSRKEILQALKKTTGKYLLCIHLCRTGDHDPRVRYAASVIYKKHRLPG